MAFAGELGAKINADLIKTDFQMTLTEKLFSESNTRFIVEIMPENKEKFEKTLKGFVFAQIGTTESEQSLVIESKKSKISIKTKIKDLQKSWQRQLLG